MSPDSIQGEKLQKEDGEEEEKEREEDSAAS